MSIRSALGLEPLPLDGEDRFLCGLECEIESVLPGQDFTNFHATEDGSLRNNGLEYISVPLPRKESVLAFNNLHAKIKYLDKKAAFSDRTSTHVHINCRFLEPEQVKNIVMLYALFEEAFFRMVDSNRRNNIHCVPLTETFLPSYYKESLWRLLEKWQKYTALNLLPLKKLGTIEFRHMQGTDNTALMEEWLRVLENLWNLGRVISITPENISDARSRMIWYDEIFGHSPRMMEIKPAIPQLIENSVIDVKLSLIGA